MARWGGRRMRRAWRAPVDRSSIANRVSRSVGVKCSENRDFILAARRIAAQPLLVEAWTITAVVLACVIVISLSVLAAPIVLANTIQADSLQPALFVRDLQTHADAWVHFRQARIPSPIPDMLIYCLLQLATGDWRIAALGFGLITFLGYVTLGASIVSDATRSSYSRALVAFAAFALALDGFSLGHAVHYGWSDATPLAFQVPVQHVGPMVLSLLAARLSVQFVRRPRSASLWGISALCAALGQADLLTGPEFLLPLLLVAAAGAMTRAVPLLVAARLAVATIGGFAIGAISALWIPRSYEATQLATVPDRWTRFTADLPAHPFWQGNVIATCVACLIAAAVWRGATARSRFDGPAVWWLLGATAAASSLAATALLYEDGASFRYAPPAIAWLSILATIFLITALKRLDMEAGPRSAAVLLGAAVLSVHWRMPAVLTWQMPLDACLREAIPGARPIAGLGDYWLARPLAASSNWRLQVDQINDAGEAFPWQNDPLSYFRDGSEPARPPPYTFIVMAKLRPAAIQAAYGLPERVVRCAESDVWVYRAGHLQALVVAHAKPLWPLAADLPGGLTIPVSELAGANPDRQSDGLHAHRSEAGGGALTWGPYMELPAGSWHVALSYRLQTSDDAHPVLKLTAKAGAFVIAALPMADSEDRISTIETNFDVKRPLPNFEIVTTTDRPARIVIVSARISRGP